MFCLDLFGCSRCALLALSEGARAEGEAKGSLAAAPTVVFVRSAWRGISPGQARCLVQPGASYALPPVISPATPYPVLQVWPGPCNFLDYLQPRTAAYWGDQLQAHHELLPWDGIWVGVSVPVCLDVPMAGKGAGPPAAGGCLDACACAHCVGVRWSGQCRGLCSERAGRAVGCVGEPSAHATLGRARPFGPTCGSPSAQLHRRLT